MLGNNKRGKAFKGINGRKASLIIRIQLQRYYNGLSYQEVLDSVKGYKNKKVEELLKILKKENEKYNRNIRKT